ncbi:MAG: hypothetical protein ABI321_16770 [Polyangia bacterium]
MRALAALIAIGGVAFGTHAWVARRRATCPLGYGAATPAEHEAAKLAFSQQHASTRGARSRPALDWELEITTRANVESWARAHHVGCAPRKQGDLECTDVPEGALSTPLPISTLWLGFGAKDTLDHVTAFRTTDDAARATTALTVLGARVDEAGPALHVTGEPMAVWLAHGMLAQRRIEYSFSTYWASLSATHMAKDRYDVIDEYRALSLR